jgi:hypothetical protein
MTTFHDLLSQHIGSAFARQLAFADLLGQRNWSLTISEGVVTFGNDLRFPIQLLGTEADGNGTWLWAWANEASNLPDKVLVACNELREFGRRAGVPELTERTFSLDRASGHVISLVASGIIGNCCYYRGPYDGGALFFLVNNPPADVLRPVPAERAVTVITQVISDFDVSHRPMAESFLRAQGFSLETASGALAASRHGDQITLSFDSVGRIANIGAKLGPRAQEEPSKWWHFWK